MFLSAYPLSLLQTLTSATCLYGLYYTYWQLTVGASRRHLAASRGCQPVRTWHAWDPLFGLGFLRESYRNLKSHTMLESMQRRFERVGTNTASINLLGST